METGKERSIKGLLRKLFGGLNMSWRNVILFAAAAAVLTVIVLTPPFKDTSFELIGVTFEAWILFAVIIMANCKKPLESALKTFVFFLISQPLIFLIQVPFSEMGWGLFRYYIRWFLWTLLTFPMAFAGWFITKKNWLSALIFAPVFCYLGYCVYGYGLECVENFPRYLLAALFCLGQIILYLIVFFPDIKKKLVEILITVITVVVVIVVSMSTSRIEMGLTKILPGDPSFSAEATIESDDESIASVVFGSSEDGSIFIRAHAYGTVTLTVTDGEETARYLLEIYKEDRSPQMRITPVPGN